VKIKLARNSGFCMGVRRAMETALEAVHHCKGPIYSHGPLIHNPQAVSLLENKGLRLLTLPASSDATMEGTVIIRAHGVPPDEQGRLESRGLGIIDATCPRVKGVQRIIARHARKGYAPIIWGSGDHPEVIGLMGYAEGRGLVIGGPEDVTGLPNRERVILVAQTTQEKGRFPLIAEAVKARWPEALIFDTICGATERRQDEVRRLASEVTAMVVVGGHHSGNTQRLAEVAVAEGVRTIHIETEEELEPGWFKSGDIVGVTAGASTPNWMIRRVTRKLERIARHGDPSIRTLAHRLLRMMILSNVYVGLGAGMLCLAGTALQGIYPGIEYMAVAFFYIQAMHLLNLFLDKEASQFNDPDRVIFLEKHKKILVSSGIFSALVSLGLSLYVGPGVFLLLLFMSGLGLLYAVPLIPVRWSKVIRFRRLKDIPVSKTLSLSGGWACSLALIPALAPDNGVSASTVLVALIILQLVFIRSGLGDIMEIQGDRIAGRETLPIIIGVKNTLRLLGILCILLVVFFIGGWMAGCLPSLAWPLLLCAGYAGACVFIFRGDHFMSSLFFEALIDANFILAGLITWIWAAMRGGFTHGI
jgi:(E)-4-hydroxy-3-methyl-but-2-enyl pyrophosphate reductase